MPWKQEGLTAVVVAKRFNVTAAGEHWLVKQGIIDEDDRLEGSIFSDAVVQVRTARFQLLLLPDQLQFVPSVPREEEQAIIVDKLGKIVETLPHVPYKALGLNFAWAFTPDDGDIWRVTREMFYIPDRPLFRIFSDGESLFGGHLSKNHAGFRLKLNVNPVSVPEEGGVEQRVQFAFNFHRDLGEDGAAKEILQCLSRWNELRAEAERIIDAVGGR